MNNTMKILSCFITVLLLLVGCEQSGLIVSQTSESELGIIYEKEELLSMINEKYEDPEAHYQLGKIYRSEGMLDKAEFEFNVALGFNPQHFESQAAMVKTLIDNNEESRAKQSAEEYINQAGKSAASSLLLGKAFQKENLDDYAITSYKQAINIAPNSSIINKHLGYYYLSRNDKAQAEEYLKRSFQLDPYQAEVAGELGRMGVVVQVPQKEEKNKETNQ